MKPPALTYTSENQARDAFARRTEPTAGGAVLANRDMMLFRMFGLQPCDLLEEALQFAQETFKSIEDITAIFVERAYSFTRQQRYAEALKEYDRVLAIDPKSTAARLGRGVLYADQRRLDDAIGEFTQLVMIAPDDPRGFHLRGDAYLQLEKAALALPDYNSALKLDCQNATVFVGRAYAYTLLGDFRRAVNDYQQAMSLGSPVAEKMPEEAERQFVQQSIERLSSLSGPAGLDALAAGFPFVTSGEYVTMLRSYAGHLPEDVGTALVERIRWLEGYIANQRSG